MSLSVTSIDMGLVSGYSKFRQCVPNKEMVLLDFFFILFYFIASNKGCESKDWYFNFGG